ncbi:PEP-CTERM sorting domain-containing protein [Colwellia sp. TT2012]|uniref:PEP-CTERM sorting domain-containing protein n=1 Tax=Colwellia sp. TT2012 TaxID=1720342 RepID=UPI00070D9CA3|nr:PEP-CTERM sorting domain-containing protein [Colwellia sp. TT2012]
MNIKMLKAAVAGLVLSVSGFANATFIDFTGGDVTKNGGGVGTTNNFILFDNAAFYVEDGFKFEFFFTGLPTAFASSIGDYYNTGNDVVHWHWLDGCCGNVTEVKVSKVDGTTFDLGGFSVSTNTSNGGGGSIGTEQVYINTSKALGIFNVASDDWGLGNGPDPLITIAASNMLFDDISWFSFTNGNNSTAVGMGLDNFFLDEAGDPNGFDPTSVPEPTTLAIFALGLMGLAARRFKKQ